MCTHFVAHCANRGWITGRPGLSNTSISIFLKPGRGEAGKQSSFQIYTVIWGQVHSIDHLNGFSTNRQNPRVYDTFTPPWDEYDIYGFWELSMEIF